jgi:RNA 2',3'-cyclic 3'-phosphodiesterase
VRLFAAVDLDDEARASIAAVQRRLRPAGGSGPRWVRPEQLHLTLVFIGQVDDAKASDLSNAFAAASERPPFEVTFAGLGAFPSHGAPRALWIGVRQGAADLSALHTEMAQRVARFGLPLEGRAFRPHLTLARWKRSRPSDRRRVLEAMPPGERAIARIVVEHVTLYQSRLSPAGSTYIPLARANLTMKSA